MFLKFSPISCVLKSVSEETVEYSDCEVLVMIAEGVIVGIAEGEVSLAAEEAVVVEEVSSATEKAVIAEEVSLAAEEAVVAEDVVSLAAE
jgi:hypothetical protein